MPMFNHWCSRTKQRHRPPPGKTHPGGGRLPPHLLRSLASPSPSSPASWSVCVSQGRQTGLLKCAFCIKLLHKNRMNCFALMNCRPYLYIRLVLPSVCPYPTTTTTTTTPRLSPTPCLGFLWGPEGSAHPLRTSGWALPHCPAPKPSIRLLSSIQSDENTVNALIGGGFFVCLFYFISCAMLWL
uniref:Uncharacterized protein n=1 Tax=Pipistrellus kuhlii TaxID=59472 RepID=A0A7J7YX50_PIPKU|nr:hypothetical protein mPipKuh1_009837 [Pipistrellus kuhlii]